MRSNKVVEMKSLHRIIIVIFTTFLFSSCAVSDFFGGVFEDVTTYFNTYYNARTAFNEAVTEVKQQQSEIFSTKPYVPPGGAVTKFINVIEKCSKILQYSSTSSFVDDALMMIGQCYFYQKEYPSAIRKFSELRDNFPNSSLNLSARFWLAKSIAGSNDFEQAIKHFNDLITFAVEEDEEDIVADAYLELMKINIAKNEYEKVISYGNEFIKHSNDDEKSSQVMLELGFTYVKMNKIEEAVKAFADVNDFSPSYKTLFRSELEFAKLNRMLKKYDIGIEMLEDLKSESIYEEFYDQVDFEMGMNFLAQNRTDEALDKFHYVDTSFAARESGGNAQYQLAKYIETNLANFDSAKYFYDRASRSQASQEIVKDATKKSTLLSKRKSIWDNIDNLNKQITNLRTFPVDTVQTIYDTFEIDSTMLNDSAYVADLEIFMKEKEAADSLKIMKLSKDSVNYLNNLNNADSVEVVVAKLKFDLGSLYYSEFEWSDSALTYFTFVVDSFPNESFTERALYALANYHDVYGSKETSDSLFRLIYDRYPTDEIVNTIAKKLNLPPKPSLQEKPDDVYYQAEQLNINKKHSEAIKMLWYLIQNHPNSDYCPKSYLMIGHIYEEILKMYDSAASAYRQLKEKFPFSLYAQKSNQKLLAYDSEQQRIEQEKKAEEEKKKKELEEKLKADEEKKKQEAEKKSKSAKKDKTDGTTGILDSLTLPLDSLNLKIDSIEVKKDSLEIDQ
ncbi:MAG: tetratricopeptide repeat protein [Bacteroidetes bacterium]|nr:tetratricopeptide repeat protein [Bacteroidota bacterium]